MANQLPPQLLMYLLAASQGKQQPQTGLQISPNQAGKGLQDLFKVFTNKGNLPSNLGDLGSILGSVLGGKGITGALAGLGGKVGGNILGGAIQGNPFSWATPGGLAGFVPTLLGLAFPKQAKYLNAGTGLANAFSQVATGQPITTLGGNAIADLLGLGSTAGYTVIPGAAGAGLGVGAGAGLGAGGLTAAETALAGMGEGLAASSAGTASGLGGGALMGMAPLLGPLGILGAMIGVGQLLTNDPSRMQKYGGKIKDLWGDAQRMATGDMKGISKNDATYIANQVKNAKAANPNDPTYNPKVIKDSLFGGTGLTFLNYLAGKDPQLSLGLDWGSGIGLEDIKKQMGNDTTYNALFKNMSGRDALFKAMYGANNPQSTLLSGGKVSQTDWDKFFQGIRNPKLYDPVTPQPVGWSGN